MPTDETEDLMVREMRCLMEHLGTFEAQQFISAVLRERFDYTKWQREYYDAIPPEKFHADAVAWAKANPGIETRYMPPQDAKESAK